jgi:hypothetical protein
VKNWGGYEPVMRPPREPWSDDVKLAICAVVGVVCVVFGLVGGCAVYENSQHRQLQTCVENDGEWVYDDNKNGNVCQKE